MDSGVTKTHLFDRSHKSRATKLGSILVTGNDAGQDLNARVPEF